MMIKNLIILCTIAISAYSQPFPQIEIPLSILHGIPFDYDSVNYHDYYINGFDVDSLGNYYFLGGHKATLVKVAPDGKVLFRRAYDQFAANQIYVRKGKIYVFDNISGENTLTVIGADSGEVLESHPRLLPNKVNDVWYNDSTFVMFVFKRGEEITLPTPTKYLKFNTRGNFLGETGNNYDLPNYLYKRGSVPEQGAVFLGWLNDTLVFQNFFLNNDLKGGKYKFWLEDTAGQILTQTYVHDKVLGKVFAEAPQEHCRLRNRTIYVLRRKGKNGVMTRIPLDKLFKPVIDIHN